MLNLYSEGPARPAWLQTRQQKVLPGSSRSCDRDSFPNTPRREIEERLKDFFASGTQIAWIINPDTESVEICRSLTDRQLLGSGGFSTANTCCLASFTLSPACSRSGIGNSEWPSLARFDPFRRVRVTHPSEKMRAPVLTVEFSFDNAGGELSIGPCPAEISANPVTLTDTEVSESFGQPPWKFQKLPPY